MKQNRQKVKELILFLTLVKLRLLLFLKVLRQNKLLRLRYCLRSVMEQLFLKICLEQVLLQRMFMVGLKPLLRKLLLIRLVKV
jgi:hypothetical protein